MTSNEFPVLRQCKTLAEIIKSYRMKNLFIILFLFFCGTLAFAQNQRTKILLMGTIHFETPHKDKFELKTDDFLSLKRQAELEMLTNKLIKTEASKVLIERPYDMEAEYDSLYNQYLNNRYKLTVSEREQIGFRLAKKLNLIHINCVDELYGNPHDSIMSATAKKNNESDFLIQLEREAKKLISDFDKALKKGSITDVIKYINTPDLLKRNLALYLKYVAKIGAGKNYAGAESVSDWYLRNLAIYSNIISQVDKNDKFVILIFGQGHIPILRHLLENNDDFEIVEVKDVL